MDANTQAPEKRIHPGSTHPSDQIDVHSIFYTIQGEGPFCGKPAVFIRLAGCNLQCPGCDTDYTRGRKRQPIELVTARVKELHKQQPQHGVPGSLVVITGGEPFRQPALLMDLCDALMSDGFFIQIETNGTLAAPDHSWYMREPNEEEGIYVVVSPKSGSVHPTIERIACAYKYVMNTRSVSLLDGLPIHALDHTLGGQLSVARPPRGYDGPIYLQPMDEQDKEINWRNLSACIQSCMAYGYFLQLQVHKIIHME